VLLLTRSSASVSLRVYLTWSSSVCSVMFMCFSMMILCRIETSSVRQVGDRSVASVSMMVLSLRVRMW